MHLTERVRIHPRPAALWEVSHCCQELWNHLNREGRETAVGYLRQKRFLPRLKEVQPEYRLPISQVLQEVVKELHGA